MSLEQIGFGGGCHWCTEAVFQQIKGVERVDQGFMRAQPPHETWSEAVEVQYDPRIVSLKDLINVHLATHASTAAHKMRGKYRSAVYAKTAQDHARVAGHLASLSQELDLDFVTLNLTFCGFKPSDTRFHNYYQKDQSRPFCQTYIDPKIIKLRQKFSHLLKESA